MKRKISVRISEELAERLEVAAALPGAKKSSIVETALDRFLESGADNCHLNRVNRRLTAIESDLRIIAEIAALHARYHLTIAPAVPAADQPSACIIGHKRFEELAAQVARRVHLNRPLMKETMDRILATRASLFSA
jgi:hypothetical protein